MKAVVQRVTNANVAINGEVTGAIGKGFVVLLGVGVNDSEKDARFLAEKIACLRIFADDRGKFDRSIADVKGEFLVVSQFTLYGDCRRGRRPDFTGAARPEKAVPLYERFLEILRASGVPVKTGIFGADMQLEIHNDGPVTLIIDTEIQT